MVYVLSNEEKIDIIDQHLKRLSTSKFNFEMILVEESSVPDPKAETIEDLENQISNIDLKMASLLIELNKLN